MRALELYAGIGGFAAAARGMFDDVVAIEQSDVVLRAYARNFAHRTLEKNIAGLAPEDYATLDADFWWLSPPCQPFTRRGLSGDADDPRMRSFLRVLEAIETLRPRTLAMENVPEFADSASHAALHSALAGYAIRERILCPTELGIPNRRRRYYLVASRDTLGEMRIEHAPRALREFLEPNQPGLEISEPILEKYRHAMSIIDPDDPLAIASCFTSAYGRSPAKSGSFLILDNTRVRRFSSREILNLLGFPEDFALPELPELSLERTYSLIGNSLSVFAVRAVLASLKVT